MLCPTCIYAKRGYQADAQTSEYLCDHPSVKLIAPRGEKGKFKEPVDVLPVAKCFDDKSYCNKGQWYIRQPKIAIDMVCKSFDKQLAEAEREAKKRFLEGLIWGSIATSVLYITLMLVL
jgi:hypothetical protein